MLIDRPRLQVLGADKDLTERCDSLSFSATDTGGYEIATLGLPAADRPRKGTPLYIRQGCDTAWGGRVAEIADHSQHGRATKTTGCEGLRALLRDTEMQMIYVDRDLTRWGADAVSLQATLTGGTQLIGDSQVGVDQAPNNLPAIIQTIAGAWAVGVFPIAHAFYDAGPGNLISNIYWNLIRVLLDNPGTFGTSVFTSSDPVQTSVSSSGAVGAGEAYLNPAVAYRYAFLQFLNGTGGAGVQGNQYKAFWRNVAVYGNHGLPGRGGNPVGYYPSDIARHALSQAKGIVPGQIVDATGYIAPHVVYRTPTAADVIVDDMAKLMGWCWGVWEPATILGSSPRLDFRPPPTDATAVVTKAECDQLDVTSRLGDLYDTAEITYSDAAGSGGMVTVVLPNAQLAEAGLSGRTLVLDMGLSSAAAATTFGNFALALSQVSARAAGQATLPVSVRLPYGGSKPACLLKPGIDRLRIVDLNDAGSTMDIGNTRRDTFRISRTETTVGADGVPSTRVELDSGTNLLETLQARLAIAAGVVGSGASGG